MTGTERLLLADVPHHVLRKARKGEQVFHDKADYRHFVSQLRELRDVYNVELHAWTLLPDRIHLVATPHENPNLLGTFIKALTCRTSLRRRGVYGERSPWEARFRASPIEPGNWLMACICYVERLPVLHKLAGSAYHYQNSSYRMRLGKTDQYWLDDPEEYARLGDDIEERADAFKTYMRNGLDEKEMDLINTALYRNRLTGSQRFVEYVYRKYGILALNRGPGRPRRKKNPNDFSTEEG
ncbi:transposase [Alloalcanivorax sp. C16-1]|uniref:transposase n=1 Tax=Alloalcanivorax sp. C16-1 TaxID=3390051 RepID=UPI003970FCDA